MGDCVYVAMRLFGTREPVVRVMPSEQWMDPAEAGRILAKDQMLNTSTGVWFYESDIYEPDELHKNLLALAAYVRTPEFLDAYREARAASRSGPVQVWQVKP